MKAGCGIIKTVTWVIGVDGSQGITNLANACSEHACCDESTRQERTLRDFKDATHSHHQAGSMIGVKRSI